MEASDWATVAIPALIDSLGSSRFGATMMNLVHDVFGADHCTVYRFGPNQVDVLGAASRDGSALGCRNAQRYAEQGFWQRDPFVFSARRGAAASARLERIEPSDIPDAALREEFYTRINICEKAFISGVRARELYAVSIFRTVRTGPFTGQQLAQLHLGSELLVSCFAKHAQMMHARTDAATELSSVQQIEERLRRCHGALTARELQVCARILYGNTLDGIAVDLRISAESVATYRKRAFNRLGIATRHELLTSFLQSL